MGGIGDFFKSVVDFVPIVGDVISGFSSAKEAKKNRQFQYEMSSTAHQREVEDLRKAGLNPILSATGGSGASTTSGSMPDIPDYGRGISSALMNRKERELIDAQIDQANAATGKLKEETDGQNLANTDKQNELDAKWGTGSQKDGTYMANFRKDQAEAVQRILESRGRVASAAESTRKEKALNAAFDQHPELATWVLSASYADREAINRMLTGDVQASDIVKFLMNLARR